MNFGEVWTSLDKHHIRKMGKEAKIIRKGNKNFEDKEEEKVGSRIRGRLSAIKIFFYKIMTKDKKKWECLEFRSFKSGTSIDILITHFYLALFNFFGKNIFS